MDRRTVLKVAGAAGLAAAVPGVAFALSGPAIGQPAPDFAGVDMFGKTVRLADLKGKLVILEWTNHDCPFVIKHYGSGTMQALQRDMTAQGAVWVSIISSAPGEQGHVSPAEAQRLTTERKAAPTFKLLDPTGVIGMAYKAQTTPHMYVIRADGALAYMGAIDDKPSSRPASLEGARPYVREAVAAVLAGGMPQVTETRAYGCSIKYPA